MSHPVIRARLIECTVVVLNIEERSAKEVFGLPDNMKLKSSMTLFEYISEAGSVFTLVLDKFLCGERCEKTLQYRKKCKVINLFFNLPESTSIY